MAHLNKHEPLHRDLMPRARESHPAHARRRPKADAGPPVPAARVLAVLPQALPAQPGQQVRVGVRGGEG